MRIIEKYSDAELKQDVATKTALVSRGYGSSVNLNLVGKTLVLFSGSWRFAADADYIEHKHLEELDLPFHKNTKFVSTVPFKLLSKILENYDNLVLANCIGFRYKTVEEINQVIAQYCSIKPTGCKLTAIINLSTLRVNRLANDIDMICTQLAAKSFDGKSFRIIVT